MGKAGPDGTQTPFSGSEKDTSQLPRGLWGTLLAQTWRVQGAGCAGSGRGLRVAD